jgi:conjugative transposon TraN protein
MKKSLLTFFLLLTVSLLGTAYGQSDYRSFYPASEIKPYHLEVGYNITTMLIFPAAISNGGIDRGSAGIIAKAVPGVENILKVKANRKDFRQTNLTVVTKDGKVYAFTVNYSDNPPGAPIDMGKQPVEEREQAVFHDSKLNAVQIETLCREVANQPAFLHHKTRSYKIKLKLQGIYSCEDAIFFQFSLKNKSNIDYNIDLLSFYVRDKKRMKRTAEQEKEIQPLQVYYEKGIHQIAGQTNQTLVFAFPKFTIADHKNLVMQLFEKNGDRNLILKINGNKLMKARPLSLEGKAL